MQHRPPSPSPHTPELHSSPASQGVPFGSRDPVVLPAVPPVVPPVEPLPVPELLAAALDEFTPLADPTPLRIAREGLWDAY